PGLEATVRMEGDTFEMEDQRNWTDASYKTYCTPLRLPFPVEVRAGTVIEQSVTLTLRGAMPAGASRPVGADAVRAVKIAAGPPVPLPRIGLGMASHGRPLSERERGRLRRLRMAHLRVDLALAEPGWRDRLRLASEEAAALGTRLEMALILSDAAAELEALKAELARWRPPVAAWLVFHAQEPCTEGEWVRLARAQLAAYGEGIPLTSGTNAYFAELNRGRLPLDLLDQVCYSINPQVHAFDDASLVETLMAQAETVKSARRLCGEKPIAISPITLKPRFNPNATAPDPAPRPDELPPQVDARQMSLFTAAWTVGSLKYLAQSGAASLTYYETTGWRGVMETEAGSPLPGLFRSIPGGVFPVYHVLADVQEFAGGEVVPTRSDDPLALDALLLRKGGRARLLLANLSPQPRRARFETADLGEAPTVKVLDETNAERAMREPEAFCAEPPDRLTARGGTLELPLRPHAVARLDWG
ncbi:MAG TPA: hypothetical protein VF234_06875, partial [Limnochordia bacterium]